MAAIRFFTCMWTSCHHTEFVTKLKAIPISFNNSLPYDNVIRIIGTNVIHICFPHYDNLVQKLRKQYLNLDLICGVKAASCVPSHEIGCVPI